MTMQAFEEWMRPLLQHTHYSDGWFWHEYFDKCDCWPTPEMKQRGMEMRAEFAKGKV